MFTHTTFCRSRSLLWFLSPLLALGVAAGASAQGAAPSDEVIVTGTREKTRTKFTTLTPIDVVSGAALQDGVSGNVQDTLAQNIPSFNVQKLPASDGQQFIMPARIRGLSPDQTLVLVNGKRFHRTSFIGGTSQGADLSQISNFAVGRIEVLRDGASAQYGSDAIAGVFNIQLDTKPGVSAFAQGSQYYKGDGKTYQAGIRSGTKLGDGGHIVATFEWSDGEMTSRTHQRDDAKAVQAANPTLSIPNPVQRWGRPDLTAHRYALDAALPVAGVGEVYAFATGADSDGKSDINWRAPSGPAKNSAYNTSTAFPGWNLATVYPTGFTPVERNKQQDYQAVIGLRGGLGDNFTWDLSAGQGENEAKFYLYNSINASLGPSSPHDFYLGTDIEHEVSFNADGVYRLSLGNLPEPVNIAFGAEHRKDTYEVKTGDEASYKVGPGANTGLPAGSNGMPGFSPTQAGSWDRSSDAGYIDIASKLTQRLSVAVATRYEDFDGIGSNTTGKIAARFEFTPDFAIRASGSTGFRAPSVGQINASSTSQGLDTKTLQLFTNGRLSNANAALIGGAALKNEESTNYSAGLVWRNQSGFTATVDAYQIDIKNRLGSSSSRALTDAERAILVANKVNGAETFTSVSWFINANDTRTKGIDLAGSYTRPLWAGRLDLNGAYNYNKTEVTKGGLSAAASATSRRLFEEATPNHQATASATYSVGKMQYLVRGRYYGAWTDSTGNTTGEIFQRFGGIAFFDAAATYSFSPKLSVRLGAENLFNTYPEKATFQTSRGLVYSRNAPYDSYGGQFYLRLNAKM